MLRSLYVMLDYRLAAIDGELGRVRDFLFDDESWVIHDLVVEIKAEDYSSKVLIIPIAVQSPDWGSKSLRVLLTQEEVRTSRLFESDLPISLQGELGIRRPGSHLRSMLEILGYRIDARDGEVGTIEDLIVEDTLWGVHHLVVALKSIPGRMVLMSPESVRTISWRAKGAWVNLTLEELENSPEFEPAAPVNHDAGHRLYDYYGRPVNYPEVTTQGRPEAQQR